MQYQEAKIQI